MARKIIRTQEMPTHEFVRRIHAAWARQRRRKYPSVDPTSLALATLNYIRDCAMLGRRL